MSELLAPGADKLQRGFAGGRDPFASVARRTRRRVACRALYSPARRAVRSKDLRDVSLVRRPAGLFQCHLEASPPRYCQAPLMA